MNTSSTYLGFPNGSVLNELHQWHTTQGSGMENHIAFLFYHWLAGSKIQSKCAKNRVKIFSGSNWERDAWQKVQGTWKTYFLHEVTALPALKKVFGVQGGISIEIPNVWVPLSMFIKHVQADLQTALASQWAPIKNNEMCCMLNQLKMQQGLAKEAKPSLTELCQGSSSELSLFSSVGATGNIWWMR